MEANGGGGSSDGSGVAAGNAIGVREGCRAGRITRIKKPRQPNVTNIANSVALRSESISSQSRTLMLMRL